VGVAAYANQRGYQKIKPGVGEASLRNKKVNENGLKNKTATLKPAWNVFGKCARIKIRTSLLSPLGSHCIYVPGQIILTAAFCSCARHLCINIALVFVFAAGIGTMHFYS